MNKVKYMPVLMLLAFMVYSLLFGRFSYFVPLAYLVLSVVTLTLYWKDKRAAVKNIWRVPESTLHLFAVLGGWPGAMIAQQQFRHKTQKLSFKWVFWTTVIINSTALVFFSYVSQSW